MGLTQNMRTQPINSAHTQLLAAPLNINEDCS